MAAAKEGDMSKITDPSQSESTFEIGRFSFRSRLIIGSGKYCCTAQTVANQQYLRAEPVNQVLSRCNEIGHIGCEARSPELTFAPAKTCEVKPQCCNPMRG